MNRLNDIVEIMGGQLSYSLWNGEHSYTVSFSKYSFTASSKMDYVALRRVEDNLSEVFPIHYQNAINQIK